MISKDSVLVGTDPATQLLLHRRFTYFTPNRESETIHVFYNEFLIANGQEIEVTEQKHYIVKDLPLVPAVAEVLDEDGVTILTEAVAEIPASFGFTNWFNYDVGVFPDGTTLGQIIVGAINTTLQAIPIGAKSGYITTPD